MPPTSPRACRQHFWTMLLLLAISSLQPATASDAAMEREHLVALVRQIDMAVRQAAQAASSAPQERTRYHFDHVRLRVDLQRIQLGIQDYLTPPRAQPRDPVELSGDYRQPSQKASDQGAAQ